MDITQDKFGSIWFGTRNGLNRFDGKRIITYKTSQTKSSILENQIRQLDSQDSLIWVRTPNSISKFDLYHESFQNYPLPSITAMHIEQDVVWISTNRELFLLNHHTHTFKPVPLSLRENETITSLFKDRQGLLIGTNMGMWKKNRIRSASDPETKGAGTEPFCR